MTGPQICQHIMLCCNHILKVLESCIYVQLTWCEEEITEICHSTSSSCSWSRGSVTLYTYQSSRKMLDPPFQILEENIFFHLPFKFCPFWPTRFRFRWAATINFSFVIFYIRNMGYLVILKEMSISVNLKSVILLIPCRLLSHLGREWTNCVRINFSERIQLPLPSWLLQKSPLRRHKKVQRCDAGDTWDGLLRDTYGSVYEGQVLPRTVNGYTKKRKYMHKDRAINGPHFFNQPYLILTDDVFLGRMDFEWQFWI